MSRRDCLVSHLGFVGACTMHVIVFIVEVFDYCNPGAYHRRPDCCHTKCAAIMFESQEYGYSHTENCYIPAEANNAAMYFMGYGMRLENVSVNVA